MVRSVWLADRASRSPLRVLWSGAPALQIHHWADRTKAEMIEDAELQAGFDWLDRIAIEAAGQIMERRNEANAMSSA